MEVLAWLKTYNANKHEVILTPAVYGNRVTSLEVSFDKKNYNRGNFTSIVNFVYEESWHAAWVNSQWPDFHHGSFTIKINVASRNYSQDQITQMLQKLVEEIFPELKKKEDEG